jgi:hypothetical protein
VGVKTHSSFKEKIMSDALQIGAVGSTITTSATSTRIAIPVDSAGVKPGYLRIASNAYAFVKIGDSTVTATGNDILLQPNDELCIVVSGNTHVAAIQDSAAGKVNVIALDNS